MEILEAHAHLFVNAAAVISAVTWRLRNEIGVDAGGTGLAAVLGTLEGQLDSLLRDCQRAELRMTAEQVKTILYVLNKPEVRVVTSARSLSDRLVELQRARLPRV